jgi:cystathionine gamma-synthase
MESPANPTLDVTDLARVIAAAREREVITMVDNTFATPVLQRPLGLGADLVVHSVTKFIGGHSDLLMGAVVTTDDWYDRIAGTRAVYGAVPGALESFLALRGLRTLPLRIERAQATARALVERLGEHPAVEHVRYPGFGAMVAFDVRDGHAADRVCHAVRLVVHATSLGGVETTMERRHKYPSEMLVPPGLIRLSVGLEDPEDLWRDLEAALAEA